MQRKLIAVLVANLFAGGVYAQGFTVTGEVGAGAIAVDTESTDASKFREYRDLDPGVLSIIDLKGRGNRYYVNFFGENLGRDDMFLKLDGGAYGSFKYALFSDSLKHNFGFNLRSPYNGLGSADPRAPLTYVPAPSNFWVISNAATPASWNRYDLAYKRRNDGGSVELSFNSPFYVRADVSQVTMDGAKLQSFANGTSPGNGFTDFFVPVDYTTKNLSFEAGYSTKRMHLALNFLTSKFENEFDRFTWNNPAFAGGIDTHPMAPDNDYSRWSANAVFKQLPMNSTLGLRYTTAKSESSVNLLSNVLNTGTGTPLAPTTPSSNAIPGTFNGDVEYETYSLTLSSNPSRIVDTRLYYNYYEKANHSTHLSFNGLPAGLSCSDIFSPTLPANCEPHLFGYERTNYGFDVGVRPFANNKINIGVDFSEIERERIDVDTTEETKYSIEWRNTQLDWVTARVKYQRLERDSNFLLTPAFSRARAAAGTNGFGVTTQGYIEGFIGRYDVSNLNQDLYRVALDFSVSPTVDLGVEYSFRDSKYKEVILGRTADERQELFVTLAFGDPDVFRVNVFGGWENVKYDSYHRVGGATAGQTLDPAAPPTTANYNWGMTIRDIYHTFGAGFDWPVADALKFKGGFMWSRTEGDGVFQPQTLASGASANPALLLGGINNYGNNEFFTIHAKAIYQFSPRIELTVGAAYEQTTFNDIQFNNYTYIIPTTPVNASTSYLSGWNADPDYKAGIGYFMVKYKF